MCFSFFKLGIKITLSLEEEPLGTGTVATLLYSRLNQYGWFIPISLQLVHWH